MNTFLIWVETGGWIKQYGWLNGVDYKIEATTFDIKEAYQFTYLEIAKYVANSNHIQGARVMSVIS